MAQIPLKEGLFRETAEGKAVLIGSSCPECGEKFFPVRLSCAKCSCRELKEVALSREGEIFTFTTVRQGPATWKGPMPYIIVWVKLDDGAEVISHLIGVEEIPDAIGKRVEVVLDKLREDQDGNEIMIHKFRLVGRNNECVMSQ